MDSRELDVRQLNSLTIPYDVSTKELTDGPPRLVAGNNTYINIGGKIVQAPGLNNTGLTSYTIAGRADRIKVYETIESTPKVYIMASIYNGATWTAYYIRLDAGAPAWTSLGTYRGINASLAPHTFTVARGLCFIKSYTSNFATNLGVGAVIFDGSGGSPTVRPWGIFGPGAAPVHVANNAGGTATTRFGYRYATAYVSTTGHISNRSPASVNTGPLTNQIPRINVAYTTETNVSFINIYRTSDGGGTLYFLNQIANNTAGGNVNYDDNTSALVAGNPVADSELDLLNFAPSETSNTVPPMATVQSVATGGAFDYISSNVEHFARRHWFALGNRLYYSGQEEILNGVPEESFPAAWGKKGNFYILSGQVRQLKKARRALYVTTSTETMILTGQDRTNFLIDTLVGDVAGARVNVPGDANDAIASFRDSVFFLSSGLDVYSVTGDAPPILISSPLGSELRTLINTGAGANRIRVQFEVYSRDGQTLLVINVSDITDSTVNRQYVYDLARNIWFTPWTKRISAMTVGRLRESVQQEYLIAMRYDGTNSALMYLDSAFVSDAGTNFTPSFTTNLFSLPSGNHINELRKPAHTPILAYFMLERTKFVSDTDPTVAYRIDEFSGATTSVTATDPPYLAQHTSYKDHWYPVGLACERAQLSVTGTGGQQFEIQNISFAFNSEAGA